MSYPLSFKSIEGKNYTITGYARGREWWESPLISTLMSDIWKTRYGLPILCPMANPIGVSDFSNMLSYGFKFGGTNKHYLEEIRSHASVPILKQGNNTLWKGSTSRNWQHFKIYCSLDAGKPELGMGTEAVSSYVEFDDLHIEEE